MSREENCLLARRQSVFRRHEPPVLEHRVTDQRVSRLIRKWLEAGVIDDGKRIPAVKGTPQGAVMTPRTQKDNFEFERRMRFDRLLPDKLAHVYQLLVPDRRSSHRRRESEIG
jgi:hypothetical protein